mgnify:CR=1 FL=1
MGPPGLLAELRHHCAGQQLFWSIQKRFLNTSSLSLEYTNRYIYLVSDFDPTRSFEGTYLPANSDYSYGDIEFAYRSDRRKIFNLDSKISYGTFFNGTKFTLENQFNWRKQPIVNASFIVNFNKKNYNIFSSLAIKRKKVSIGH